MPRRAGYTPSPAFRVIDTLPPDATIISTTNPEVWIRRDFTTSEVADLISSTEDYVRALWRRGQFPNGRQSGERKAIVIPGCDVQALLEEQRIKAPGFKARRQ